MKNVLVFLTFSVILLSAFSASVMGTQTMSMDLSNSGHAQTTEHFPYGHPGPSGNPAQVIHVKALDIRFEPKNIMVHRGETVRFVVSNDGKLTHEFVIGDAALQAAHEEKMQAMAGKPMSDDANGITLLPGQAKDFVWTFTREGVTEYACHEPGHFAAGMVGKIFIISAKPR